MADEEIPSVGSLVDMIKQWESGKHVPSPRYTELLHRAFAGDGGQSVGSPRLSACLDADDVDRLIEAVRNPIRVDEATIDGLAGTLAGNRRIEDLIGSAAVKASALGHLDITLRLAKEARSRHADRLAAIASEASQFTGWLASATGDHDSAGVLYDQALRLGLQAGDNDLAATALSMRGHLAWVTGDVGEMAGLSRAAASLATTTATRTVAVQQEGRALAILGERQEALRSIGQAEELLTHSTGQGPDGLYFLGGELLTMQRGLILTYLAGTSAEHVAAANLIADGIEAMPPALRNSEWVAWYRVQAAVAYARGNELEAATSAIRTALTIVTSTEGNKTRAEIMRTIRAWSTRWPTAPTIAELSDALR